MFGTLRRQQAQAPEETPATAAQQTGFLARARLRRRLRFLRQARELAYRDLGGLVFDLHRFGRRRDELVMAKLEALGRLDEELRTIQRALGETSAVTILREAGIAPCPRCGTIHASQDRFCPSCGLDLSAAPAPQGTTEPRSAPAPQESAAPRTAPEPNGTGATGKKQSTGILSAE